MTASDVKQTVQEAPPHTSPSLTPSLLPSGDNITFRDSSFFARKDAQLPTPAEVRQAAGANYELGNPPPVLFSSLDLLVKYGSAITVAEGQCLWAIRRFVPQVPVPEVYGWRRDNGETFIYMQLVRGCTLEQSWPQLNVEERLDICRQLRHMLASLRQLRQDPADQFVGNINHQSLHDILFDYKQPAGPFPDVTSFYRWFTSLSARVPLDQVEVVDPIRAGLIDSDDSIVFTHADLHRSNIMVSDFNDEGPIRILAIIDWHQSGWYPAAWEFFKTRFTARGKERWEDDYVFEFLQSHQRSVNWEYCVHGFLM